MCDLAWLGYAFYEEEDGCWTSLVFGIALGAVSTGFSTGLVDNY